MKNKHIIIVLLIIIVVLLAAIGLMMMNPANAKEPTKIKITSDKEQTEGGKLSIKLTDLNNTPISKEVVNITVTNKKSKVVVDDVVKTDSKGKAKLDMDLKKGKYNVTVTYDGNGNYTGNTTKQKLSIKTAETTTESATKTDNGNNPVYCSLCGAYVATQYEIDHAPGAGYFINPATGKTICDNCAAKLMEEEEAFSDDYEYGEQDDGSYIDSEGNYWSSYDEYLYVNNHPDN